MFDPTLEGRSLTFSMDGERIADAQTGSGWDILGRGTAGPLAGKRLRPIVSGTHFWFSWIAFKPQARVVQD